MERQLPKILFLVNRYVVPLLIACIRIHLIYKSNCWSPLLCRLPGISGLSMFIAAVGPEYFFVASLIFPDPHPVSHHSISVYFIIHSQVNISSTSTSLSSVFKVTHSSAAVSSYYASRHCENRFWRIQVIDWPRRSSSLTICCIATAQGILVIRLCALCTSWTTCGAFRW